MVTAAPSGNAGSPSKTTTPLCTRPGMTMQSLFGAWRMEASRFEDRLPVCTFAGFVRLFVVRRLIPITAPEPWSWRHCRPDWRRGRSAQVSVYLRGDYIPRLLQMALPPRGWILMPTQKEACDRVRWHGGGGRATTCAFQMDFCNKSPKFVKPRRPR